jgi:hypothetical protein
MHERLSEHWTQHSIAKTPTVVNSLFKGQELQGGTSSSAHGSCEQPVTALHLVLHASLDSWGQCHPAHSQVVLLGQQQAAERRSGVMSHATFRSSRVLLVGYPADEVAGEDGNPAWEYHPPPLIKRVLTDPSSPARDSFIHLADPQPPGSLGE